MGYKNLYISKQVKLNVKQNNLVVKDIDTNEIFRSESIEDLNSIVIEDQLSSASAYAINKLAQNHVLAIICDDKHMPCSIVLPLVGTNLMHKRHIQQLELTEPFKKNIWKQIIQQKIENQANVLKLKYNRPSTYLIELSKSVKSGDTGNYESIAAKHYFERLYYANFTREDFSPINTYLNYGYAIIRACIARSIVAHGLSTDLGLFHNNQYNAFNLADDFIEPFRQIVDLFVYTNEYNLEKQLNTKEKASLCNLLNYQVQIKNKLYLLHYAVEECIQSFITCIEKNDTNYLSLPKIVKLVRPIGYV